MKHCSTSVAGFLVDQRRWHAFSIKPTSAEGALESYVFTLGLWYAHFIEMSLLIVGMAVSVHKVRPEPSPKGGQLEMARTS